jgi:hypothetical protein
VEVRLTTNSHPHRSVRPCLKNKLKSKGSEGGIQVVEHLPSKCEAEFNPQYHKNNNKTAHPVLVCLSVDPTRGVQFSKHRYSSCWNVPPGGRRTGTWPFPNRTQGWGRHMERSMPGGLSREWNSSSVKKREESTPLRPEGFRTARRKGTEEGNLPPPKHSPKPHTHPREHPEKDRREMRSKLGSMGAVPRAYTEHHAYQRAAKARA